LPQDLEKAWQVLEEEDCRRHAVKAVVETAFSKIRAQEARELIAAAQAQAAAVHQVRGWVGVREATTFVSVFVCV
jgi:hypothetical protein